MSSGDSSSTAYLPCLCPLAGPGSCLLVGRLCRGGRAGSLCLPVCTFILLEKELQPEGTRKGEAGQDPADSSPPGA